MEQQADKTIPRSPQVQAAEALDALIAWLSLREWQVFGTLTMRSHRDAYWFMAQLGKMIADWESAAGLAAGSVEWFASVEATKRGIHHLHFIARGLDLAQRLPPGRRCIPKGWRSLRGLTRGMIRFNHRLNDGGMLHFAGVVPADWVDSIESYEVRDCDGRVSKVRRDLFLNAEGMRLFPRCFLGWASLWWFFHHGGIAQVERVRDQVAVGKYAAKYACKGVHADGRCDWSVSRGAGFQPPLV